MAKAIGSTELSAHIAIKDATWLNPVDTDKTGDFIDTDILGNCLFPQCFIAGCYKYCIQNETKSTLVNLYTS